MAKSLPRPVAAPGTEAKGSSTPVTDEQGSVRELKLKVSQVRATSPFLLSAEPGLVLIQQAALSLLFLTGHKGTLQSVLLPHVDLETTGNNRSMLGWFVCFLSVVLRIGPRASPVLGKCSTIELYPQFNLSFLL